MLFFFYRFELLYCFRGLQSSQWLCCWPTFKRTIKAAKDGAENNEIWRQESIGRSSKIGCFLKMWMKFKVVDVSFGELLSRNDELAENVRRRSPLSLRRLEKGKRELKRSKQNHILVSVISISHEVRERDGDNCFGSLLTLNHLQSTHTHTHTHTPVPDTLAAHPSSTL